MALGMVAYSQGFVMNPLAIEVPSLAGTEAFGLNLHLQPTQALLIQGDHGYSSKGPSAGEASYYYSAPHLAVSGSLREHGRTVEVSGDAWLDHEWSSSFLAARSAGWDWTGLNLDDGS